MAGPATWNLQVRGQDVLPMMWACSVCAMQARPLAPDGS